MSTGVEKAFDKIQCPFIIIILKALQKVGIERAYLNIINVIYNKPIAYILLNVEKLTAFPLRLGRRQASPLSSLLFTSFGSPSHRIREEEEIKGIQKCKKEVTLSLFANDVIIHTENPKEDSRKLLELISEFNKVAGYKIHIQKSVVFL